jgi:hypothetical protein
LSTRSSNVYNIFVGKYAKGKDHLGDLGEDGYKTDLREKEYEGVDWIYKALLMLVMSFWVP